MKNGLEIQIVDGNGDIIETVAIPSKEESEKREAATIACSFLDKSLARDFREAINASPIFHKHPTYKAHFNLACAVMDRLETCVFYLNEHQDYPHTEEEFLQFIMFACMLMDAVKQILLDLGIDKKKQPVFDGADNYANFKSVCKNAPLQLTDEQCPTDDEFWEYFRSITFAHPFGTDRPKFLEERETQYSPWVIVHTGGPVYRNISEPIGVRIYSSTRDQIMDLVMPFSVIKGYIKSRYERISLATKWAKEQIALIHTQWKKEKIDRNQPPENMLLNIRDILKMRYVDADTIGIAYEYLTCKTTNPRNDNSVRAFRDAICDILPKMCDAVESLDYEELESLLDSVVRLRPVEMHAMAGYQLEKIFCYLHDGIASENVYWAQVQADAFSKEFASKWVVMDAWMMSFDEIKLLTQTACYIEAKNQAHIRNKQ